MPIISSSSFFFLLESRNIINAIPAKNGIRIVFSTNRVTTNRMAIINPNIKIFPERPSRYKTSIKPA